MKLNYDKTTDSLYIDLSSKPSSDSLEISEGVVLDYDSNGNVTGIYNASIKVDLNKIVLNKIPAEVEQLSA